MSNDNKEQAQDLHKGEVFSQGLDRSFRTHNEQSFVSTNAMSHLQGYQSHDPTNEHGSKQQLMNALNNIKGKQKLNDTQGEYEGPRKQRDISYLLNHNSIDDTNYTDMYFSKNIDEKLNIEDNLKSIIDDTESELGQRDQPQRKSRSSSKFKNIKRPSWVEILLLISIFVIAYLGQNQYQTNLKMEQMLTVMNDQSHQLKIQKTHLYNVMKRSGISVQQENDVQAQNAKKILSLKADINAAEKRITLTEQKEESLKQEMIELSSTVGKTVKDTKTNSAQISEVTLSQHKLEQQLKQEKDEMKTMAKDTKELQKEAQDSEETLSEIQSKEKSFEKKIDASIEQVSKQNAKDIKNLQGSVEKYEKDLANMKSENSKLQNQLVTVSATMKGLKSTSLETKEDIKKLNEFIEGFEKATVDEDKSLKKDEK